MENKLVYRFCDGSEADLLTTSGADVYLDHQSCCPPLSKPCEFMTKLYKKKLNLSTKQRIRDSLVVIGEVLSWGSESLVANLPAKEIESWVDFATMLLRDRSKDPKYIKNATLQAFDMDLLNALLHTGNHVRILEVGLERGLFHALAGLIAARKAPNMPNDETAESFCTIYASIVKNMTNKSACYYSPEKILKLMEDTGLLAQFIRCSTVPFRSWDKDNIYHMYVHLLNCQVLIRKKFKRGQPSGDVIDAILMRKDGHKTFRDQKVLTNLRSMQKIAVDIDFISRKGGDLSMCRYCNELGEGYQTCSRCLTTRYCSRECQKKDWKGHKPYCHPMSKELSSAKKSENALLMSFLDKYRMTLGKAFADKMKETGLDMSELLLELNFYAGFDGTGLCTAPSLRDPPEFKIGITKRYFEGDRPDEPDWFRKSDYCPPEFLEERRESTIANLVEMYKKITSGQYLVFVMQPTGPDCMIMMTVKKDGTQTSFLGT
mmetsp:Transcript_14247/g.16143  ORF Transcript_14247/g.16143 Transcript_14247/m.16143 type:complete len:489 (-) Transcript_14247:583-2049(-)